MVIPKFREPLSRKGIWVAIFSEFIGTVLLVFLVVGVAYINFSHGEKNVLPFSSRIISTGIGVGVVVAGLVFTFAFGFPNGSAHINPAFTLGCLFLGKLTVIRAIFFFIAQFTGAIFGAVLLYACFPSMRENCFACTVVSDVKPLEGVALEFIGTFTLVFGVLAICSAAERHNYGPIVISLGIGILLAIIIIIAAPYTSASLNPARSFGPALIFGGDCWTHHWIYWLGPLLGGLAGGCVMWILQWSDDNSQKIAEEMALRSSGSAALPLTLNGDP